MTTEENEKQYACFLAAALLAPITHAAPSNSWPVTLTLSAVCLSAAWWLSRCGAPIGKFLTVLQGLWSCVIAAMVLRWAGAYWPGHTQGWAAPLILLLLAAWASSSKERAARVGCVLLLPILISLAAVLISGIPEIRWDELRPKWLMRDADLIPILLLPALTRGKGKGKKLFGLGLFGIGVSAVTAGVLSYPVSAGAKAPVYELSRSIAIFGIGQRFESLTALAMTLGYFAALGFLLDASIIENRERESIWTKALLTAVLFLCPVRLESRITAIGSVLIYLIIPALNSLKNFFIKKQKSA